MPGQGKKTLFNRRGSLPEALFTMTATKTVVTLVVTLCTNIDAVFIKP